MITTGDGDGCYLEISDEMGAVGRFGDPNLLEVPAVHGSERGEVDAGAGDGRREHAVAPSAEPRQEVGVAHVVLDWTGSKVGAARVPMGSVGCAVGSTSRFRCPQTMKGISERLPYLLPYQVSDRSYF